MDEQDIVPRLVDTEASLNASKHPSLRSRQLLKCNNHQLGSPSVHILNRQTPRALWDPLDRINPYMPETEMVTILLIR